MRTRISAMALMAVLASASQAQTPMPAAPVKTVECPAMVAPPANFAGWDKPAPLDAGTGGTAVTPLPLGAAAQLTLKPQAGISFTGGPKPGDVPNPFGGVLVLDIAKPGKYQIAASAKAWLDVIGPSGPVGSVAHGHGPNCTSIAKIVDFDLAAGRYLIEISGARAATLAVMAAPAS